jgi:putative ABC transport system permease protein
MDTLIQDIRVAIRGVRAAPGLALSIIATLAVAIGANALVFSVVDGVLLKPLPFAHAARLVAFTERNGSGIEDVSALEFTEWEARIRSLDAMVAWRDRPGALTGVGTEPMQLRVSYVSPNFFSVLGVSTELGRSFIEGEGATGREQVAILSDALWRDRFGSDPHVVGRRLLIDSVAVTVVGVAPSTMRYPEQPDVWRAQPFGASQLVEDERGAHNYTAIGRLRSGVAFATAKDEVIAVTARLRVAHLKEDFDYRYLLSPLQDLVVGEARLPLLVLQGAVGCVLLIACVNIANLLLARAMRRASETGLRIALGASRKRIVRELLGESAVLAATGGALGLLLTTVGLRALLAAKLDGVPRLGEVTLDWHVLLFASGLVILTVLLFGIAPAMQASGSDVLSTLKSGTRGASGTRSSRRLRSALVIAETSIAVVLLVGAGLLTKSFTRLLSVDPGFRPEHVVSFSATLAQVEYPLWAQRRAFTEGVIRRLEALPGTQSAGAGEGLPFTSSQASTTMHVVGRPPEPANRREGVWTQFVTPGAFTTLDIPIVKGRAFSRDDRPGGHQVVMINETLARRYFPGEDPIGRTLTLDFTTDSAPNSPVPPRGEIVGIAGDTKRTSLASPADPVVYMPYDQVSRRLLTFVVRTKADPASVLTAARQIVAGVGPDVPMFNPGTFDANVRSSVARPALDAWVVDAFAGVALLLSLIGIYGVISYSVRERTRELGIRMALGARQGQVVQRVVGSGVQLAVLGVACGLAVAAVGTRLISSLLYDVAPVDWPTYASVAAGLLAVATLASWLPARRAARIDPVRSMRVE